MDLAYLIATGGEAYREAVSIAVRSLRRIGRFAGEIVVFSDRQFPLPRGVELELLAPHEVSRPTLKCHTGRSLPLERYQRVLYLDSDIVVRAPLEPLLARCATGRLVCTDDMGAKAGWDWFSKCFSPPELLRFGDLPGLNAGFFCAEGARLREWLTAWESMICACAGCPGSGIDQPPFNAAIRRGLIPVEWVPEQMWFPHHHPLAPDLAGRDTEAWLRTRHSAPLAHFTGTGVRPEQLQQMSNEYARQVLSGPLRALAASDQAPR